MSQSESYYEQVQAIIRKHSDLTWDKICNESFNLGSPFTDEELSKDECEVFYKRNNMENVAWRTSLALMSWSLRNFKNKAADGHCHNTTGHTHGRRELRKCDIGQEFHTRIYNMCLKSFKDELNTFDSSRNVMNSLNTCSFNM